MDVNAWLAILTAVLGLVAMFLRSYMSSAIAQAVQDIREDLHEKFGAFEVKFEKLRKEMVSRELHEEHWRAVDARLDRIQTQVQQRRTEP